MKGYLLGNMDIEFYGKAEEFSALKESKGGLQGKLEDVHGEKLERKFSLSFDDKEDFSDGIEVKIVPEDNKFSYRIRINQRAIGEVQTEGIWGSRYVGGCKIILSTKHPPWDKPTWAK